MDIKLIKGFEDYGVDCDGNVYSFKYNKERVLKPNPNLKGYLQVGLTLNGKKYPKRVHRLVAEAFIPNPHNLPQINHKDGNKLNNSVSNLEWCTNRENIKHSWDNGMREIVREKARTTINSVRISKPVEMVSCANMCVIDTFPSSKEVSRILFPAKDPSIVHAYINSYKNREYGGRVIVNGVLVFFRHKEVVECL